MVTKTKKNSYNNMKVKVSIPTSLDDITIGMYQELEIINSTAKEFMTTKEIREFDNKMVSVVTGIKDVDSITSKDRTYIIEVIGKALFKQGEFKDRFVIDGVEYGMIPNLDKVYGSEYTDLIKYYGKVEDYHRFLAVAYRPTKLKDIFKNYSIVEYSGTSETAEIMKKAPMGIVNGFNAFFLTLSNDLEAHIQKSMLEEQVKGTAL